MGLRFRKISIYQYSFFLVIHAYNVLSSISNLIRFSLNHHYSLSVISEQDYIAASIWWAGSIFLFSVAYLGAKVRISDRAIPLSRDQRRNDGAVGQNEPIKPRLFTYLVVLVVVLLIKIFNPFASVEFGTQTAQSLGDLQVGGSLIDGLLTYVYTALALAILPLSPLFGLPAFLVGIYFLLSTGSKGMAAGYVIFAYLLFSKRRNNLLVKTKKRPAVIGGLIALVASATLLTLASRIRFGVADISVTDALTAAVGRFTQQDVAAVIYTLDDWRERFQVDYVMGNIMAFIPGFLNFAKPINPAYEINAVYGGSFTAASPSIFGALLIAFGSIMYWPVLTLIASAASWLDTKLIKLQPYSISRDYSWLVLHLYLAITEANFVIAVCLITFIGVWHAAMSPSAKKQSPRLVTRWPQQA
jgi:hypothetical protein